MPVLGLFLGKQLQDLPSLRLVGGLRQEAAVALEVLLVNEPFHGRARFARLPGGEDAPEHEQVAAPVPQPEPDPEHRGDPEAGQRHVRVGGEHLGVQARRGDQEAERSQEQRRCSLSQAALRRVSA